MYRHRVICGYLCIWEREREREEVLWILSLILYHFQFIGLEFSDDCGVAVLVGFLNVYQLVSILTDDRCNFAIVNRFLDEFLVEIELDRWVFHNRIWSQHQFSFVVFCQLHYRSGSVSQCAFYQADAWKKKKQTIFNRLSPICIGEETGKLLFPCYKLK